MSDSHIYELQNIVWDDFSISDDHLVPYPQIQFPQTEGRSAHIESQKKLKHEAGVSHGAEYGGVATEKTIFSFPKIDIGKVLANGSSSYKPEACQNNDLMENLFSDDLTVTKGNFMSNNNIYFGASYPINNSTAAENNIISSMSDTPHSGSELSFSCHNSHENREIEDSFCYDWPEVGNYDLSQMLRSCDSASGLGDLGIEDDIRWFSSAAINDNGAASQLQVGSLDSDSNSVKIISGNYESRQPTCESPTVDSLKKSSEGASYSSCTLPSNTTGKSCLSRASFISKLPTDSNKMVRKKSLKEVNMNISKMDYMETNTSQHQFETSKMTSETQLSPSKAPPKLSLSTCNGPEKQNESLNNNFQSAEHSLEETSFLHLQEVMEQMDLKTKLCIRDSLYRLARNAEQRHEITTLKHADKADKKCNEASIAGTKYILQAGFLITEADTNPMDRTIAHLLFHRPNESTIHHSNTKPGNYLNDGGMNFHVAKTE